MCDKKILLFWLLLLSCFQLCMPAKNGQCESSTGLTNSNGVIYSHPGFDGKTKHKPKVVCTWNITGQTGKIVHLHIESLSIGNCSDNYLTIKEYRPSRSINICNGTQLRDFYSGGKSLEVTFITFKSPPTTGFNLTYKLISKETFFNESWCFGPYRLGGNSGRIEQIFSFITGGFDCPWIIENKKSLVIRLRILEFSLNVQYRTLELFRNEDTRDSSKSIHQNAANHQDIYFSVEKLKVDFYSAEYTTGLLNISYEVIHRSELASLQTRPKNLMNVENGTTVRLYCNPPMRTAVGRVNLTIVNGSINFVKNPDNTTAVFFGKGNKFSAQHLSISETQLSGLAITFVATMKYEGEIRCTVEKKKNKSDQLFPEPMVMSKSVILTVIASPKIIKFKENTSKVVIKSSWIYNVVYGIGAVLAITLIITAIFVIRRWRLRRTQSK